MNNQDFIGQLSNQLKPVKRVKKPFESLSIILISSFIWIALGVLLIGVRVNILKVSGEANFWFSNAIILILAVASLISSLRLSIPDRHHVLIYLLPAFSGLAWLVYLTVATLNNNPPLGTDGILCVRDILVFSLLPLILTIRIVSQGSVLQKSITGTFSLLGSAALGALGTQFTCQDNPGLHVLVWHLVPVILLMVAGFLFSSFWFGRFKYFIN